MKRNSHIASLFRKHEAKKVVVDDVHIDDNGLLLACIDSAPPIQSDCEIESETEMEESTPNPPSPQESSRRSYDSHFFPHDLGKEFLYQDML